MNVKIEGARENNLKDLDVEFQDGLTVVTGVSGSGKSSLVFNTLYHEARRRYLELFTYGKTGLRLSPANVRSITNLGPTIAVGQNLLNRNPNSTLATASGLHPFFRLLFTRFGERMCLICGHRLSIFTEDEIIEKLRVYSKECSIAVYAQLVQNVKGSHATLLKMLVKHFSNEKVIVDNKTWDFRKLNPNKPHKIQVNIAKLDNKSTLKQIQESIGEIKALGAHIINIGSGNKSIKLSLAKICPECGAWFKELKPKHFHMPCPYCKRKGCEKCNGTGFHPLAVSTYIEDQTLPELLKLSVKNAADLFEKLELPSSANRVLSEIAKRLLALQQVGLEYLALDRSSPSLSRGESQRVRIAITLVSQLEDILHVLDEPTIGQHPADINRFMPIFRQFKGNVIFVEHDRNAASYADHNLDLGPEAGIQGGEIVHQGSIGSLWKAKTHTGRFFSFKQKVVPPKMRTKPNIFLKIDQASKHNLKNIDVEIPLHRLTVITGVSGSGKSTLVENVLFESLKKKKPIGCKSIENPSLKVRIVDQSPIGKNPRSNPATYTKIAEIIRDLFAKKTKLSSSHFSFNRPEGACPMCKGIGALEIKMRFLPSTWITCVVCNGDRFNEKVLEAKILIGERELSISDVLNLSISEFHELIIKDKRLGKSKLEKLILMLKTLEDIGLGYLSLGQPSPSLSGGEAQRIKLSKFLGKGVLKNELFILDEPSTGLHPKDLAGLLNILDKIVRAEGTVVIVEHDLDVIKAADWIVDLGPGAGDQGGKLIYMGNLEDLLENESSLTAQALRDEENIRPKPYSGKGGYKRSDLILVRNAAIHNLKGIDVSFLKNSINVVTGVSGSGKSSLVVDIIEAESKRRYLETLSMYERQSIREGPEAQVDEISGLGVVSVVFPEKSLYSSFFNMRIRVGNLTEISYHLSNLFAFLGDLNCPNCGDVMSKNFKWSCHKCNYTKPLYLPKHFQSSYYRSACRKCNGVGTLTIPNPEKLIIYPDKPLCNGAMYSPGFFPKGYLCKPYNGGYYMVQALAEKYQFDQFKTPWNKMSKATQNAFLYGTKEKLEIHYVNRKGEKYTKNELFFGFYNQWIRDWDIGGTFSDIVICDSCNGARLRPEYLEVKLNSYNIHELSEMPLVELLTEISQLGKSKKLPLLIDNSLKTIINRLTFLTKIGLGYINLNRGADTLSVGEAQRIRLAGLISSGITNLTILLDEPSRGLSPPEIEGLVEALKSLRDNGNTIIMVEHDISIIQEADNIVDLGPGAGVNGGEIVAQGTIEDIIKTKSITGKWLDNTRLFSISQKPVVFKKNMKIYGARANNLKGETIRIPLGILVGICGVSGSGKSTLLIDTIGRALAPIKHTTSTAHEILEPGEHDKIEGAPSNTIIIDQTKTKISSPLNYLGLKKAFLKLYAESDDAQLLNIDEKDISKGCTACKGKGFERIDMGFLPDILNPCEICEGTGYSSNAWQVKINGVSLPEVNSLTIDEVYEKFKSVELIEKKLKLVKDVGLGYLVLNQPAYTLSGGEAQRLKIAKELSKSSKKKNLYILDEPTIGQHMEDIERVVSVLRRLVKQGHSVVTIEHHPHFLASCDWIIELGPGAGPEGGRVVAEGMPIDFANSDTRIAPFIKEIVENNQQYEVGVK